MHKYSDQKNTGTGTNAGEKRLPVAIVGARGYSGAELVRLLLNHPAAEIHACFASEAGFDLSDYLPDSRAAGLPIVPMDRFATVAAGTHTVFLATPAEVSAELAPVALAAGANVIDLSGAFRLSPEAAQQWYGLKGKALELLPEAHYGLVPWAGPHAGAKGKPALISNPGCYATSVLMAALPLLKSGVIRPETLVIDAKSGATGAGRKPAENLLFCEVEGECLPYKVGSHQHLPEIREMTGKFSGVSIDPMFSTHLLNTRRGIIAGLYARTPAGLTLDKVEAAYAEAYNGYPLVRHGRIDPKKRHQLSLKRITGSARTEIRYELKGDQLYVFSLIDNLLKGAASQAVENFNRLLDCAPFASLTEIEGTL